MASSERVQNVLTGASELPPDQRTGYLDAACRGDAALRAEVESLLKSLDDAGEFLAAPTAEIKPAAGSSSARSAMMMTAAAGVAGGPPELEGQMIGRYKLLQPIGEGGFGSVWMAEQREPVKRRVALKIIKLGMDTRQVIARFEAERQALAMMDHPNIAKVLDAGATDAGRPYFVMEYIRGVPILEYCDTEKLNTRARLELFGSVCHAIQHAHQKGIIHRDIKPSNVLVTMHDGVPVPKVIDFGIAKATSNELTTKTLFTEHRQMIGTPAYMSPEQAEMSGLDIDTRSDIYSLGVLLYELLTGTTPFGHAELMSKGFAEMLRIIREVEPHKPSTRLSSLGETGTRTAQQRQAVDSKRLGGTLRGDLDWIVMKCLDKDRTRRYESASGLAADIRRHLSDEPITAGAPSAAYKLHKFVKRNRVIVGAGGVVAAALVLGAIGATAGMISASNARDRAEFERTKATLAAEAEAEAKGVAQRNEQRAIAEAARAEEAKQQEAIARKRAESAREEEARARSRAETISNFVTSVLRSGDSQNLGEFDGAGQDMTVLKAMDNAVRDVDAGRFKDDPETEAQLLGTIAQILANNGRAQTAEALVVRALELNRGLHQTDHPDLASSLEHVAQVRMQLGKFDELEAPMVEAVAMRRRLHEAGDNALAGTLQSFGELRYRQGRLPEAAAIQAEALQLSRAVHSGDHPELAICLNNLALVLQARGYPEQSEPLFVEALEMHRRLYAGDHPEVATGLNNLGFVRCSLGREAEAESMLLEALEMRERLYKGDHPSIASSLANLAAARGRLQRPEDAEPLAARAVEMNRRLFRGDHQAVATSLVQRATILQSLGRTAEAEKLLVEALEMNRRVFKGDNPDNALILNNLGALRQQLGRADEAEPLLSEALRMRERMIKGDHPLIVANLRNIASAQRDLRRDSEAQILERRANEMAARIAADSRTVVQEDRGLLAVQHWERGELDKSVPMFESLLKDQERTLGREHPLTRETAANLGVNYKDSGRLGEGIALLEAAYQDSKKQPELEFVRMHLLDAYARSADSANPGTLARATAFIEDFVATARNDDPPESSQLAAHLSLAAQAFLGLKVWNKAEPLAREALAIRELTQPDVWNTYSTKSVLGGTLLGQGKLAEAEPLLLDGYRGMKARESTIPPQGLSRLTEALDRLIMLASTKGELDKAAQWRAERAKYAPARTTK